MSRNVVSQPTLLRGPKGPEEFLLAEQELTIAKMLQEQGGCWTADQVVIDVDRRVAASGMVDASTYLGGFTVYRAMSRIL